MSPEEIKFLWSTLSGFGAGALLAAGAKRAEQVEQNVRASGIVDRSKVWEIVDQIAARHGGTPRASSS